MSMIHSSKNAAASWSIAAALGALTVTTAVAEDALSGAIKPLGSIQFAADQDVPCLRSALETGAAAAGPSTWILKAPAGCVVPWHTHTAGEGRRRSRQIDVLDLILHKRGLRLVDCRSYGMSGRNESEEAMAQQLRAEQPMQGRSRAWLEAECLTVARRTANGKAVERVMIRRLNPKGAGPNWKVADIIPQPTPLVSGELRQALASLTGIYTLEDEPR